MGQETRVLVGTSKGAFVLRPGGGGAWTVTGPYCDGWPINHVIGDPASGALWAAGGGDWHGAGVWHSPDGGTDWRLSKLANGQADAWLASDPETAAQLGMAPSPPAPFTDKITTLWSLGLGDGAVFAGAKPAALFRSQDAGETWDEVRGLREHPSSDSWNPGAAGLVLHSIVTDPANPARQWVAISAAGVFATEDGGTTWDRRNRLSNAVAPGTHSHPAAPCGHETGMCVHSIVRAVGRDDLLYQQNHHGTYRSRDGGRSWDDITAGLPTTFGFPIAVHPRDPDTVFVLPLNSDVAGRYPTDGAAAVWRSRDGGSSWVALRDGLPQQCFFTVLRQGMAVDRATPTGVYFGTNTGSVFASHDDGESWQEIARHLPTVLSVETLTPA